MRDYCINAQTPTFLYCQCYLKRTFLPTLNKRPNSNPAISFMMQEFPLMQDSFPTACEDREF